MPDGTRSSGSHNQNHGGEGGLETPRFPNRAFWIERARAGLSIHTIRREVNGKLGKVPPQGWADDDFDHVAELEKPRSGNDSGYGLRHDKSGDIDLEDEFTQKWARKFFTDDVAPKGTWVSGRKSARSNHYIFAVAGKLPFKKFVNPFTQELQGEYLQGPTKQTVIPGSRHVESGEDVEFEEGATAQLHPIDERVLARRYVMVLMAALIDESCRDEWNSARHDVYLWLSGLLAKHWPLKEALLFANELLAEFNDDERADRVRAIKDGYATHAAGKRVGGGPKLKEALGEKGDKFLTTFLERIAWAKGADVEDVKEKEAPQKFRPIPFAADILLETDLPERWLVKDHLLAHGVSLWVAKPKVGKSTTLRHLALCVAQGKPFLGWDTVKGTVIYLSLEEQRGEVRRHFKKLGLHSTDPLGLHSGVAPQDTRGWLEWILEEYAPKLIVIDTLQKVVRSKDINAYSEITNLLEPLQHLAHQEVGGLHIALSHHAKKGQHDTDDGDEILGSTGIEGNVDATFLLRKFKGTHTIHSIQRSGPNLEKSVIVLDANTEAPRLHGTLRAAKAADWAQRILAAVADNPRGLDMKQLRELVPGDDHARRGAVKTLTKVDGPLVMRGTGRKNDPTLLFDRHSAPPEGERLETPAERRAREAWRGQQEAAETSTPETPTPEPTSPDADAKSLVEITPASQNLSPPDQPDGEGGAT